MFSRISALTNLPTPLKVGLLLATGCSFMVVIQYIIPPQLRWIVFIGLAVVALLLVLYWRLLKWLKKRKAAPMERAVSKSSAATPMTVSEPARMARVDDLRKIFQEGIEKFHAAGKSLYSLPWYLMVGEPGSGKTEAIRHCNIGFPPGLQDQYQGVGGTINMNWWFTDHAVVLDTAGRLMFEEVEASVTSEWKEFLNLLKKFRLNCPINGVFLVIPADSLIKDTADEIERKASQIAHQFDTIQRTLDVRFPVFVVISKSDLINGFREFFDDLSDPQLQHQILGWSNPAPLDDVYDPKFIDQYLTTVQNRLFRCRLKLMQEIPDDDSAVQKKQLVDAMYAFPQSLAKITSRLARYLDLIFSVGSQWSGKPLFFRGIYFTSSMREGSALDEDLAEALGMPIDSLPDGRVWERDRAYFLRDLFMKKVFREWGLVTRATNARQQHSRRRAAVLLSAAVGVILLLLATVYATVSFQKSIGQMKEYLQKAAALTEQQKVQDLQVLTFEGQDRYRYLGRAGIPGMPEDVKRFNFSARLADIVRRWEEKGVPWIFAPAAKFAKGITKERLTNAQAGVYELGVLQPFINAASDVMDTQRNGKWTRQDSETKVLHQLICIKANKPLDKEGEYSAKAFWNPLFEYIFRASEDYENRMKIYNEDKGKLHQPLGIIYSKDWPASSLRTDPEFPDKAIENGVNHFIEYWSDPNRLIEHASGYDRIKDIGKLKDAFERFDTAENTIFALYSSYNRQSGTPAMLEQFQLDKWNKCFEDLRNAKESIDSCTTLLKTSQSLEELWADVTVDVLKDVNENFEFLLNEIDPNKVKKGHFLDGVRGKLETVRAEMAKKLLNPEFEEKLRRFDGEFWSRLSRGRLYEIRFEMYAKAYEQLGVKKPISGINQVADAIRETEETITKNVREVSELRELAPNAFRFQKAAEVANFVLSERAKPKRLYYTVKDGLEAAPRSIGELEKLIEEEFKEGRISIPIEVFEKKYDPGAAAIILDGCMFLGKTLKDYNLPDAAQLKEMYVDVNTTCEEYMKLYVDYWLDTVPNAIISMEIQRDIDQFKSMVIRTVFDELLGDVGEPLERAIASLNEYIPQDNEKLKRFRVNLDKLRDRNKYDKLYNECRQVVTNWRNLSDEVFEARAAVLSTRPADFREDYVPFSCELPAEFVDMYWTKLTRELLRQLADQVQQRAEDALGKLKQYGDRFPLARFSAKDLTPDELRQARFLMSQVAPGEKDGSETIGGGAKTGIDWVDVKLRQLRGLSLDPSTNEWIKATRRVLQGLPEGEKPYFCRMILLDEKQQRGLVQKGENLLLDYLTEFRIIQGSHIGQRHKTRSVSNIVADIVEYPGSPIRIEFYRWPSDTEPTSSLPEFSGRWACLRILHQCNLEKKKGYIKLSVKDEEVGGVLFLQLEFCREYDTRSDIDMPDPSEWP